MRISIFQTERTHSYARTPSVTDGGLPQSTVSCASTMPETVHHAAHSRAIDALGFRRTLQAPLAELRSRDTARASALQQAFGIVDRTSFAERSRSVHLSAYVKACFGLCSESSDREFRPFQALALELSRNAGPRWRHRTVTRSSVDLAVRLYVNVVGPDHAFANGALERTGFIGFLARHTGIDARTLGTAIGRDYLRSIRVIESRDGLDGNLESQPLTGRVVRLNGAPVPIDAPRAHAPTLTSQLWRHVARFVSQEDIPSLSAIDPTARTTFAQTAREIRLFFRAKQTSSLADVRWFLDPLVQPDDARDDAIRDASADTRTGLLRVLAARLVAIDDRHDALQAFQLIIEAADALPPSDRHAPLHELANAFLWGKAQQRRSDLVLFLCEITGRRYTLHIPDKIASRQLFDRLVKAPTDVLEDKEQLRLQHHFSRFESPDWMYTDEHQLALKLIIDRIDQLPETTRASPLVTLYAAVWRRAVIDTWQVQGMHAEQAAGLDMPDMNPYLAWLRRTADTIPERYRTVFPQPTRTRADT